MKLHLYLIVIIEINKIIVQENYNEFEKQFQNSFYAQGVIILLKFTLLLEKYTINHLNKFILK